MTFSISTVVLGSLKVFLVISSLQTALLGGNALLKVIESGLCQEGTLMNKRENIGSAENIIFRSLLT